MGLGGKDLLVDFQKIDLLLMIPMLLRDMKGTMPSSRGQI